MLPYRSPTWCRRSAGSSRRRTRSTSSPGWPTICWTRRSWWTRTSCTPPRWRSNHGRPGWASPRCPLTHRTTAANDGGSAPRGIRPRASSELHTLTAGWRQRRASTSCPSRPVHRYGRCVRESGRRNAALNYSFLFKRFFSFSSPRDSPLNTKIRGHWYRNGGPFHFPPNPYHHWWAESIAARILEGRVPFTRATL